jgi:hypothetical protein
MPEEKPAVPISVVHVVPSESKIEPKPEPLITDGDLVELKLEPEVEPEPEYVSYPVPNIAVDSQIQVNLINEEEVDEHNVVGRNLSLIVKKIIRILL